MNSFCFAECLLHVLIGIQFISTGSVGTKVHQAQECNVYPATEVLLSQLQGDWYVQDYANAPSTFKNQTCIKLSLTIDKSGRFGTFVKSYHIDGNSSLQRSTLTIIQQMPGTFILINTPTNHISSQILLLSKDGTFIHSSCDITSGIIQNQRITTATRQPVVNYADVLKSYTLLGANVTQNHLQISQNNCLE